MRSNLSSFGAICLACLTALINLSGASAAEACSVAVQATRTEWQALSQGRLVAPAQRIATGDGRRLAGSAINYAHALLDRAESACRQGRSGEALDYVREAQALFHPAAGRL